MIFKPPRSVAELSPRLKAISELALEKFTEEDPLQPLVDWSIFRRILGLIGLFLTALLIHIGLNLLTNLIESPSDHSLKAAKFREKAKALEDEASELRQFAALGKSGQITAGGWTHSPRSARNRASRLDTQAAVIRNQAYAEDRLNQGFPAP